MPGRQTQPSTGSELRLVQIRFRCILYRLCCTFALCKILGQVRILAALELNTDYKTEDCRVETVNDDIPRLLLYDIVYEAALVNL